MHHYQTDFTIVAAWQMCVLHGEAPRSYLSDVYQLHSALALSFLHKLDAKDEGVRNRYFDPDFATNIVKSLEKEFIQYDCKSLENFQ